MNPTLFPDFLLGSDFGDDQLQPILGAGIAPLVNQPVQLAAHVGVWRLRPQRPLFDGASQSLVPSFTA